MSRIIPIFTYLQSVQVNVVERAVDARCQIMRHLDTPLALPRVISLSLALVDCSLVRSNSPTTSVALSLATVLLLRPLPARSPSLALPFSSRIIFFSYGLAVREPDKNTRAEKEKSAQLGSLNALTHREHGGGWGGRWATAGRGGVKGRAGVRLAPLGIKYTASYG